MTHKPSKEAAAKDSYSSVYVIGATCFNEYFLSHVTSGNVIFSKSLSGLRDFFNRHIAVFFETSLLKEVRILDCLHNNNMVLISKF